MARLKYKLDDYSTRIIETKLGQITVDEQNSICFPKGIVGFPNLHHYCLTEVPENKLPGAFLLQSLEDEKLAFITIPLVERFYTNETALIKYEDLMLAASSYGIKEGDLKIYVIAKIQKIENQAKISINLKAPILLNDIEKVGYQHVFIKNEYPLSYFLS